MIRSATPIEYCVSDLIDAQVQSKFATLAVVVVYHAADFPQWLETVGLPAPGSESLLFFCFEDVDEAIYFCDSIPDSRPFATVYHGGVLVHENT